MLNNKVVVVTGGAGLIGRAFVSGIARSGGTAIIADNNLKLAEEVCRQVKGETGEGCIDYLNLDITSSKSLDDNIELILKRHGRIDALVNNAYPRNHNYGKTFFNVEYDDFVENVGLNAGGYFLASQRFSKYFRKVRGGNIVNIASIYGVIAPKFHVYHSTDMTMPVEYAAIKSSIIHLTKYMAKYLREVNIRVNSISPGGVADGQRSDFIKAYNKECGTKGMLDGEDLTGTLIYLLSDMSKYVNGQNIIVDDGFTL